MRGMPFLFVDFWGWFDSTFGVLESTFCILESTFGVWESTFGVWGVHFLFRGVHSVSTKLPTCIILHNFASQPGENGALLLTLKSFLGSALFDLLIQNWQDFPNYLL